MKAHNTHILQFIIISIYLLVSCTGDRSTEKLQLENDLYSKTFQYQITNPGAILVEYLDKSTGEILTDKKTPLFELKFRPGMN